MAREARRMRLPNGFGSITKLGGSRRNPYWARKTVGKDLYGKPILKPLKPQSMFHTYNDAYSALMEYNKNPYDLNPDISLAELYDKWTDDYFQTLKSDSSSRTIKSAWSYCSVLWKMRVKDIRSYHLKNCINDAQLPDDVKLYGKNAGKHATAGTKGRIKSMFNMMFDYAVEYEIADKNYSRVFNLSDDIVREKEKNKVNHINFTDEEINLLWEHVNDIKFVDMILIGIYSGWRPQELATLKLSDIDLEGNIMFGGSKTEAGKNRVVPIHVRIKTLLRRNMKQAVSLNSIYLFNDPDGLQGTRMTYDKYRHRFDKVITRLSMDEKHRPHDTRHTFITLAKKAYVDEYAIKRIVGHVIMDITENVYTHRDVQWLITEMNKIK